MEKNIETLTEFLAAVEQICSEWDCLDATMHPWFRGQADASRNLIPGLYRDRVDPSYERELVRDFRLRSSVFFEHPPNSDLEWLFMMQHYGMPTRLLDWTEGYLIALYFAVSDRAISGDGVVWVLDPWSINNCAIGMDSVPTADHPALTSYSLATGRDRLGRKLKAKLPVAVRPSRTTPRIIAQRGTFTIHGSLTEGIEMLAQGTNSRRTKSK